MGDRSGSVAYHIASRHLSRYRDGLELVQHCSALVHRGAKGRAEKGDVDTTHTRAKISHSAHNTHSLARFCRSEISCVARSSCRRCVARVAVGGIDQGRA